jgi:hypothetical protein
MRETFREELGGVVELRVGDDAHERRPWAAAPAVGGKVTAS